MEAVKLFNKKSGFLNKNLERKGGRRIWQEMACVDDSSGCPLQRGLLTLPRRYFSGGADFLALRKV